MSLHLQQEQNSLDHNNKEVQDRIKADKQKISELLAILDANYMNLLLEELNPDDIGGFLANLDTDDMNLLLAELDADRQKILARLDTSDQKVFLAKLHANYINTLLAELTTKELTGLLYTKLDPNDTRLLFAKLDSDDNNLLLARLNADDIARWVAKRDSDDHQILLTALNANPENLLEKLNADRSKMLLVKLDTSDILILISLLDTENLKRFLAKLDAFDKIKILVQRPGSARVSKLRRYHNSVGISFAQLLDYAATLPTTGMPEDIQSLLHTFRDMAERFYTQYECSLLEDIKHQWEEEECSKVAKLAISEQPPEATEVALRLLNEHERESRGEYKRLIQNFPSLLQTALDKLRDEWLRVSTIASSSQALTENKDLIETLEWVVETTAHYVGVEAERIAVVPGKDFSLYFFKYLENFAVLSVPIYSVQAPWEWSIFWHELAGYKVRRMELDPNYETPRNKLQTLHKHYHKLPTDEVKNKFLSDLAPESPFGQGYLRDVFAEKTEPDLNDLGSFEHQFEQILQDLPRKNRLQEYQAAMNAGWCVDWVKELFEDAWSVISIDRPFLIMFVDILKRHGSKDERHPSLQVRMDVARRLLDFNKSDYTAKPALNMADNTARQLLKFLILLKAGTYKSDEKSPGYSEEARSQLYGSLKDIMKEAIDYWRDILSRVEDPAQEILDGVKGFTADISTELRNGTEKLRAARASEKNKIQSTIDTFLEGRDYKTLPGLSFFDRDFFSGFDIKKVEVLTKSATGAPVWAHLFSDLKSSIIVDGLKGSTGDVQFTIGSGSTSIVFQTTKSEWNKVFPGNDQYHIA